MQALLNPIFPIIGNGTRSENESARFFGLTVSDISKVLYLRDTLADSSGSTPVVDVHNYAYLDSGRFFYADTSSEELGRGVASIHELAGSVLTLDSDLDRDVELAFQNLFESSEERIL